MQPVAILRPTPDESPGTLTDAFVAAEIPVRLVDLFLGSAAIPPLETLSGLIVLGGTMSVGDEQRHAFLGDAIRVIRAAVEQELPVLGICLGSQLVAAALGAEVRRNRIKEIGWYELQLTADGHQDPLLGPWGSCPTVFEWHGDTFDLPPGAVHLAATADCQQQAFRFGRTVYGVQFHPEVTREIIERWVNEPVGQTEIATVDGADAATILERLGPSLPALERAAALMFDAFAQLCAEGADDQDPGRDVRSSAETT